MPNTERSYPDRLQRARTLQASIAGFTPVFIPQDANIAPDAFNSYCNGAEAACDTVTNKDSLFTDAVAARNAKLAILRDTALRVKDLVSSNIAWKQYLPAVKDAADAVRGYATKKKAPDAPAPAPGTPAKKARMGARTQQGYTDIEKAFDRLIEAVKKVTGYAAPAGSNLSVVDLTTTLGLYSDANNAVPTVDANAKEAQRMRKQYGCD